jgi:hypothetical protein
MSASAATTEDKQDAMNEAAAALTDGASVESNATRDAEETLSGHAFWSIALVGRAPGDAACASKRHARARLAATRSLDKRVNQKLCPMAPHIFDHTCVGDAVKMASKA